MEKTKYKLILGSRSPRRKELMKGSFLDFEIKVSDIDEVSEYESPIDIALDIATQKACAVYDLMSEMDNIIVIGADTIVVLENEILGKPKDKKDARQMLRRLSGTHHQVITAVSIKSANKTVNFYAETQVTFHEIGEDLLEKYLDTGDSLDKAGSYGIQGEALGFIDKVNGSYSNVVGLPIDQLILELKKYVGSANDLTGKWREHFE